MESAQETTSSPPPPTRNEQKEASLRRILDAAAARLREEGLNGAAIATVMRDAGLTHGGFYAHFANKGELAIAALRHALQENRRQWVGEPRRESWGRRLQRLAKRYLIPQHRDRLADACALAALASEAAHADAAFRSAYGEELQKSLVGICAGSSAADAGTSPVEIDPQHFDEAIACMALCVGGMTLARAVALDAELSDRILQACITAAGRLSGEPAAT